MADLFYGHTDPDTGAIPIPVVYTDAELDINGPAYVFRKANANNQVADLDISRLLSQ